MSPFGSAENFPSPAGTFFGLNRRAAVTIEIGKVYSPFCCLYSFNEAGRNRKREDGGTERRDEEEGVVAYVEVWSSSRTENYSKAFTQQLIDMGAKVSKTFHKQVTHVIFKEGLSSTWNRAQKAGIKLVSVLWVEKCRELRARVDESLYPAINTNEGLPQLIKKHKCMQPKDFVEKTPEKDKRLQKRLNIMAKELAVQKAATETDIPVLFFEDDGSLVYSPASKIKYQCSAMERRIKDMKEKRENLSPTASQMSQVSDSCYTPAVNEPILVSTSSTCVLSGGDSSDHLNSSFTNLLRNSKSKNLRKGSTKCVLEVESVTDVSMGALGSSPVSTGGSKHTNPRQPSGKHLRKKVCLEGDLLPQMAKTEMSSAQKHGDRNDWFTTTTGNCIFQANNDYRVSPEKNDHLEVAESRSNNCSNSEIDLPSINPTLSPGTTDCSSTCKKQKKPRRSSLRQNTSVLSESDSQSEFLKSVLTPVESTKDQDTSFEDYFSPSNLNKNKIRVSLPFQFLQKSEGPNGMVCKYSHSRSNPEAMLQGSSKTGASYSEKKKRVPETENAKSSDCMLSWNKESATINCMSDCERDTMETPDCLLNPSIHERISTTSINRCSPTPGGDKLSMGDVKDGSCDLLCDQMNETCGKLKSTGRTKKPSRTLVMTNMSSEKQNAIVQVVKKLGGFLFSDEVCENTSHVIAGSPCRTLNVLMGIARGCWILCYEWVLWSLEYGHWISEEPYELSLDFPAAPLHHFCIIYSDSDNHNKEPGSMQVTKVLCQGLENLIQLPVSQLKVQQPLFT
ncbi:microcephalin isoform X2 [Rhineura floridana]|uniref:microcephalin isoform X2 n=1 Tax=Rhineura floridana TaxID=261503 RepID=UPI002AC86826|nr:microcephalin isoform X2 [Rhineura floridana]